MPPPTSNTLHPQAQARAAVVVKPSSGTIATMSEARRLIKTAALLRGAPRRGGACEVMVVVDMVAPIGFVRRDAAGRRRACGRTMKVKEADAIPNMIARSEFEVDAEAGGLDDEIGRALQRIGSPCGVGDRAESVGGAGEAREQVLDLEGPVVGPGVFPSGAGGPA